MRFAVGDDEWGARGLQLPGPAVEFVESVAQGGGVVGEQVSGRFGVRAETVPGVAQLPQCQLKLGAGRELGRKCAGRGRRDRAVQTGEQVHDQGAVVRGEGLAEVTRRAGHEREHADRVPGSQPANALAVDGADRRDDEVQAAVRLRLAQSHGGVHGVPQTAEGGLGPLPVPGLVVQVGHRHEPPAVTRVGGGPVIVTEAHGRVLQGDGVDPPCPQGIAHIGVLDTGGSLFHTGEGSRAPKYPHIVNRVEHEGRGW